MDTFLFEPLHKNHTPTTTPASSPDAISSLYPAIVQCFTIILCGYVSGRAGWITSNQSKGLSKFTSSFVLPALLFSNMAVLDWSKVEWLFLLAILASKSLLFIVVGILSFLITRPYNIGLAALIGIFVTQSNDFALGYPIVQAIYSQTQPQFLQYIYLIAPISLVILNPIGFVLLEIQKAKNTDENRSCLKLVWIVLKQIITNPIIVMTIAGLIANFIFNHTLPPIIANLLDTLGKSFSACALFILGHSIVGKLKNSSSSLFIASGLLIFAKLICFPLIAMELTRAFDCGASTNSTADYSMFAFLYGTFPTAPSVFLYATQYSTGCDIVATALVLGTVASAPLMFISAMMFGMQVFDMNIATILTNTYFDVSVLSLIGAISVVLLFVVTKRATRMPHLYVLIMALLQIVIAVGIILEASIKSPPPTSPIEWWEYLCVSMQTYGMIAVSCMCVVCSVTELLISKYSLCAALRYRPGLLCYGLGLPAVVTGLIILIGSYACKPQHGPQMFQETQLATAAALMTINVIASVAMLIISHRKSGVDKSVLETRPHSESTISENSLLASSSSSYGACDNGDNIQSESSKLGKGATCSDSRSLVSIEDIVPYPTSSDLPLLDGRTCPINQSSCDQEQRSRCKQTLRKYDTVNSGSLYIHHYQLGRLIGYVILLLLFQVTVILFYIWQLALKDLEKTTLFVEVNFICAVLTSGQGFFTFLIYGLDSQMVISPFIRWIRALINRCRGSRSNSLISKETEQTCQQFRAYHQHQCQSAIVTQYSRLKSNCFEGRLLVDWLIESGLCTDELDSVLYCNHLLLGKVIKSVSEKCYQFSDLKIVYQFLTVTV